MSIPEHKWYEFFDTFTRIDEELAVLIKLVQQIRDMLYQMAGRAPVTVRAELPVQMMQGVTTTKSIISLPKVRIAGTRVIDLTTDYKKVSLTGDVELIVSSGDVYVTNSPSSVGFLLYGGTYLVLRRSSGLSELYFKTVSTSCKLYILDLEEVWEG